MIQELLLHLSTVRSPGTSRCLTQPAKLSTAGGPRLQERGAPMAHCLRSLPTSYCVQKPPEERG